MSRRLANAKRLLAIAESGDARREAYRAAAEEVAAHKAETDDTNRLICIAIQISESKLYKLLAWRDRGYDTDSPYDEGPEKRNHERARVSHAKRALADPGERDQVLTTLAPADRIDVATELLSDPVVVEQVLTRPTPARSGIRQAIDRENDERYRVAIEQGRQRAQDEAMPVSTRMATIAGKMTDWALEMEALTDDLGTLPEGRGRALVLAAAQHLERAAQRWIDRLDQPARPELEVIEGRVA